MRKEKGKKKEIRIRFRNEIQYSIHYLTFPRKWREELMYLLDPSGLTGLEPAASALTGRCSDQLNYNPRQIKLSIQYPYFYDFNQTVSIYI